MVARHYARCLSNRQTELYQRLKVLLTDVRVPEVSAGGLGDEVVPEADSRWYRALADEGRAVHVGRRHHVLAVPVEGRAVASHHVGRVHDNPVALANLRNRAIMR